MDAGPKHFFYGNKVSDEVMQDKCFEFLSEKKKPSEFWLKIY